MNITHENEINGSEEKGRLIKNALLIVDKLAMFDIDGEILEKDVLDELNELIYQAKKLKKNRWWKLR